MDGPLAFAFGEASRFLVQAVRLVPNSEWDAPGIGTWNIRELVAHANRAHTTVQDYLGRPHALESPSGDYFSDAAVAERGRAAVVALGEDPASSVARASEAVISLIERTPSDAIVKGPMGELQLRVYLPSRIAELTIHALDVIGALEIEVAAPSEAVRESLAFLSERIARKGQGELVLFALTGRSQLPFGYSTY